MPFVVVYAKITEDKIHGIIFNGPILGPVKDDRPEAERAARKLVNENRNSTIIPRIYEAGSVLKIDEIVDSSRGYFESMKRNMTEAKEVMGRPVRRKKRRRPRGKKPPIKIYDLNDKK